MIGWSGGGAGGAGRRRGLVGVEVGGGGGVGLEWMMMTVGWGGWVLALTAVK